jgi:hypothetical protein
MYVVVPGWNPHKTVKIPLSSLDFPLRTHAYVNLGTDEDKEDDLKFEDWEWNLKKNKDTK